MLYLTVLKVKYLLENQIRKPNLLIVVKQKKKKIMTV